MTVTIRKFFFIFTLIIAPVMYSGVFITAHVCVCCEKCQDAGSGFLNV
jgi:hypothetical protein